MVNMGVRALMMPTMELSSFVWAMAKRKAGIKLPDNPTANNRRHLGQEKPRARLGRDQRFLREDSPVIPVIYGIQYVTQYQATSV